MSQRPAECTEARGEGGDGFVLLGRFVDLLGLIQPMANLTKLFGDYIYIYIYLVGKLKFEV